jgi:hypothetical protein
MNPNPHTNPVKTPLKLIAILFAVLASFVTPAIARAPQGRHITGTIRKVDATAKEVEMLREDKGTVIKFVWNKQTDFIVAGQFADPAILTKGARVEVIHHEPFFGSPFVRKVTLLSTSNPNKKTK